MPNTLKCTKLKVYVYVAISATVWADRGLCNSELGGMMLGGTVRDEWRHQSMGRVSVGRGNLTQSSRSNHMMRWLCSGWHGQKWSMRGHKQMIQNMPFWQCLVIFPSWLMSLNNNLVIMCICICICNWRNVLGTHHANGCVPSGSSDLIVKMLD